MKKLFCGLCAVLVWTVNSQATVLLSDDFTYPNGALTNQLGVWVQNGSSIINPIQVSGNKVTMQNNGQDVNRALSSPFGLVDGTTFYIGLTLNISAAQATGDYFLHWSPANGSTIFLSRLEARSSGSGFQLGYLETSGTGGSLTWGIPVLTLGQDYRVVVAYNVVAGAVNDTANVYVDPTSYVSEGANTPYLSDTWNSVTVETATLGAINLRQGTAANAPTLSVDNLVVATTFSEMAVPEPSSAALVGLGLLAWSFIRRRS